MSGRSSRARTLTFVALVMVMLVAPGAGLGFTNIANDPSKVPNSVRYLEDAWIQNWKAWELAFPPGGIPTQEWTVNGVTKMGPDWNAGISVFDFNGDGYDDLFMAQGRGHASHLYRNDFASNGNVVKFVDVAATAGVSGVGHDSSGSCVADVDNDGDYDLVVLGQSDEPIFYRNKGNDANGNFLGFEAGVVLSPAAPRHPAWTSCAFGDVDGDGFNDLIVSLGWNSESTNDCRSPITGDMNSNVLFMNHGGGASFVDETASRNYGMGPNGGYDRFITWVPMAYDYDGDGDLDIFDFNDQCALFGFFNERGSIRIHENDGTGHFTEVTVAAGTRAGIAFQNTWMGGCMADFDKDGEMDMFGTNFGNQALQYAFEPLLGFVPPIYQLPSRVFWGGKSALNKPFFTDPHLGAAPAGLSWFPFMGPFTPADPSHDVYPYDIGSSFGFGCMCADLDNDGNSDIAYMGDMHLIDLSLGENPGIVMLGDGTRNFVFDRALTNDVPSQRRLVKGVAMADFNNDGHIDVVSVAGSRITEASETLIANSHCTVVNMTLQKISPTESISPPLSMTGSSFSPDFSGFLWYCGNAPIPFGTDFKPVIGYAETLGDGDLAIQMNDGTTNGWIRISLRGTVQGKTARDGIGSTLTVTPCDLAANEKSCASAGLGSQMGVYGNGASTSSSHTFVRSFGLGASAGDGAVQVKWTNGVRNNYWVKKGETKVLPQINCEIANNVWANKNAFTACVNSELNRLQNEGIIAASEKNILRKGMEGGYDLGLVDTSGTASATRTIGGAQKTSGKQGTLNETQLIGIIAGASLCALVCICAIVYGHFSRQRASVNFEQDVDGMASTF